MLPSARPMFQSLPLTVNADGHSNHGRVPNSFSEAQLQNEETVPLRQAISPDRSTSIHLVEESDGEGPRGILRRNSSSRLHSSMSGNPVCHPEQEDYATMAPTLVMAAAEPHMSFDPDKPCCDAAVGEHSLTPANSHNSVSETLCKSNRWNMSYCWILSLTVFGVLTVSCTVLSVCEWLSSAYLAKLYGIWCKVTVFKSL